MIIRSNSITKRYSSPNAFTRIFVGALLFAVTTVSRVVYESEIKHEISPRLASDLRADVTIVFYSLTLIPSYSLNAAFDDFTVIFFRYLAILELQVAVGFVANHVLGTCSKIQATSVILKKQSSPNGDNCSVRRTNLAV